MSTDVEAIADPCARAAYMYSAIGRPPSMNVARQVFRIVSCKRGHRLMSLLYDIVDELDDQSLRRCVVRVNRNIEMITMRFGESAKAR